MKRLKLLIFQHGLQRCFKSDSEINFDFPGAIFSMIYSRGVKPLILSLSMVLKKNTAESKGMLYGIPALDAVRKFSNEAWLFFSQTARFFTSLHGGRYS
jgi:hypothetical protein